MHDNAHDIPATIRELRRRLGLTQEKFAARLGVAFPTINRWENDHTNPSPLALKQIETLLAEVGLGWVGRATAGEPRQEP
jgi:transcriptional regulator with XRE-family HTH domain